jgi:hypothetical protein
LDADFNEGEPERVGLLPFDRVACSNCCFINFQTEDLITPMLKGDKALPMDTPSSKDTAGTRALAVVVLAGCAYVVYRLVNLT